MTRPPLPASRPPASLWRRWWQRWWGPATTAPAPGKSASPRHDDRRHDDRRNTRTARRDQLYAVVRENMIRAGVLSGSYKFKVLTLDHDGASHLVLIDIESAALEGVPEGTLGLERELQQLAEERLQLEVRAVYWRLLGASVLNTAPARTARTEPPPAGAAVDPVEHEELAALHRALDAHTHRDTPRGFEPTRPMTRQERGRFAPLSETQLGDLD